MVYPSYATSYIGKTRRDFPLVRRDVRKLAIGTVDTMTVGPSTQWSARLTGWSLRFVGDGSALGRRGDMGGLDTIRGARLFLARRRGR